MLGTEVVLRGDLNDIKEPGEKRGGLPRSDTGYRHFREFIKDMINMGEIKFLGRLWTWANNREGEGFVEERLDRFFASPEWHYNHPQAVVHHVPKQASDHCLLVLEDKLSGLKVGRRFQFDMRLLDLPDFEYVVSNAWNRHQEGTPMYQVCERIKMCRVAL